jgi:transposase InsO family protein
MRMGVAILLALIRDAFAWLRLGMRSTKSIKAENLFLRQQLGLFIARGVTRERIHRGEYLRSVLETWTQHYNRGRPHMSLGPGIPDSPAITFPKSPSRHHRGEGYSVHAHPILGRLHHEYCLVAT